MEYCVNLESLFVWESIWDPSASVPIHEIKNLGSYSSTPPYRFPLSKHSWLVAESHFCVPSPCKHTEQSWLSRVILVNVPFSTPTTKDSTSLYTSKLASNIIFHYSQQIPSIWSHQYRSWIDFALVHALWCPLFGLLVPIWCSTLLGLRIGPRRFWMHRFFLSRHFCIQMLGTRWSGRPAVREFCTSFRLVGASPVQSYPQTVVIVMRRAIKLYIGLKYYLYYIFFHLYTTRWLQIITMQSLLMR